MWRRQNGTRNGPPHNAHGVRAPASVNNAIREDALVGRHAALVARGTDKDGHPKLFGLFSTFPWDLQKESALLALHFGSVALFIVLLLLWSILATWPLLACSMANNLQPTYRIFYPDPNTQQLIPGDTCQKTGELSNFATKMSPGNFCGGDGLAHKYECATECYVPEEMAIMPSGACLPPCRVTEDSECCNLQGITQKDKEIPSGFTWLWCVASTLLFGFWMLTLQYLQYGFAEAGNVKNINMSQYAVLLSNVGSADCDDMALKAIGRRYGDVVAAFHVRNFGRFLAPNLQLQNRRDLLIELQRIRDEKLPPPTLPGTAPIQLPGRFDSTISKLFLFIYERILCYHRSVNAQIKTLEDTDEEMQERVKQAAKKPDQATGNAIIIFDSVAGVANMLHEHNLRNKVASMLFPPGWGRALNVATGGALARTPKLTVTVTKGGVTQTMQRHVSVKRAPEPSDIWWESTLYGGWRIVARRVVAWTLYVLLLCVALAVQIFFAVGATEERLDRERLGRSADSSGEEVPGTNQDLTERVELWKFTIGKALATVIFGGLGTLLCRVISDIELYLTATQHIGSMVIKLTVFQLLNGFVVPIVAVAVSGSSQEGEGTGLWFAPGGLVDIALLVQLSNAIFPNILALFRLDDMAYYHFLSRMACSKVYACKFLHPPAFRLNLRLPNAIYTVGLSILYTPILPVSPFIGLVALLVQYAVDQYIALRHSSKPRSFQVEALAGVNYVLRVLPLVQIGIVWALYSETEVAVVLPAIIGILVWAAFALVPVLHQSRLRHFKRWVEGGRPRLLQWAKEPGYLQPTWTNHKQQTCTMSVVPDVPDGIRFNYDTYLPDCVSLDPSIFTQHVKPHFYYHKPPLPQIVEGHDQAQKLPTPEYYQTVEPSQAVTQALHSLQPVRPPATVENTCNFRQQILHEGPALAEVKGGWFQFPQLLNRRPRLPRKLSLARRGSSEEDSSKHEDRLPSPKFMPPSSGAYTGRGWAATSATGRQVFVPAQAPDAASNTQPPEFARQGVYVPGLEEPRDVLGQRGTANDQPLESL